MKQGILFILISVGLAIYVSPGGGAARGPRLSLPTNHGVSGATVSSDNSTIMLAQRKEQAPEPTSADKPPMKKKPDIKRPESKRTKPKQTRKKSKKQAAPAAPIKPFKPSEKIDADQAVDFPYDI